MSHTHFMSPRFTILFRCLMILFLCTLGNSAHILADSPHTNRNQTFSPRYNDYDPRRYAKFFGTPLSYEQWKCLPRGVQAKTQTGPDAYVVSLTSWPPRTGPSPKTPGIWLTIESLMQQTPINPTVLSCGFTKGNTREACEIYLKHSLISCTAD